MVAVGLILTWVALLVGPALAADDVLTVELRDGAVPKLLMPVAAPSGQARYHEHVGVPLATELRRAEEGVAPRIANGLPSYVGEHPFFAGLVITLSNGQTSVCGAALVTNFRLVTAAQCWWDGSAQALSMTAVLGSVRLFSGGTRVSASTVIAHGSYNPSTLANDIAVLVIPYVSSSSSIGPIALPAGAELYDSFAGRSATAIGYGKTSDWASITTSAGLRDVYLTVLTNSACAAVYGGSVTGGVLCSSGAGARGPCGGDGGGPLVLSSNGRKILVGVVSFVSAAGCQQGDPAGYTRVTAYAAWLDAQM